VKFTITPIPPTVALAEPPSPHTLLKQLRSASLRPHLPGAACGWNLSLDQLLLVFDLGHHVTVNVTVAVGDRSSLR